MWPGQGLSLKVKDVLYKARSDFQVRTCPAGWLFMLLPVLCCYWWWWLRLRHLLMILQPQPPCSCMSVQPSPRVLIRRSCMYYSHPPGRVCV